MGMREEILEWASDGEVFGIEECVNGLRDNGTSYTSGTIRTHIISRMCKDAPMNHCVQWPDLERVGRGRYRLVQKPPE